VVVAEPGTPKEPPGRDYRGGSNNVECARRRQRVRRRSEAVPRTNMPTSLGDHTVNRSGFDGGGDAREGSLLWT